MYIEAPVRQVRSSERETEALHCRGSAGIHGNSTLASEAGTPGILRLLHHMAPPIFHQGNRATLTFPYCTGTPLPHTRPHALCLIHGHQSHVSHCRRDGRRRSKNHLSKQRARALTLASKRCPGEKADGHTCNLPSLWGRTRWSPRHPSLQAKQPLIAPLEAESHP